MMVFERLMDVFKEVIFEIDLDLNTVTLDSRIREDLSFNSINMLLMAIAIESNFGIELETADIDDFKTVNDIVMYIGNRISNE